MPKTRDNTAARRLARSIKAPKFTVRSIKIPQEFRAAEANRALMLGFSPDDIPIRKAFEAFKDLDPANPWHWRLLVFYLADAFFGERKPRKIRWSQERLLELAKRAKPCDEGKGDLEIARQLLDKYPADYFPMTAKNLAKVLRRARLVAQ